MQTKGTTDIADDTYTLLKSSGNIGLAFGVPRASWEQSSSTSGAQVQIYHSGKIRLGHTGATKEDGTISTSDSAYNVVIDGGNAKFSGTIYSGAGKIANWTIDEYRLYTQNGDGSYNSINAILKDGDTLVAGSHYAIAVAAPSLTNTIDAPF